MNLPRNPGAVARAAVAALLAAAALAPAVAADGASTATEQETLAAITRQIELLDRLAERAQLSAPQHSARYHFDYDRLRGDIGRLRSGVRDYLRPQRAQPRDPLPLVGDYTRDGDGGDGEETPQ